MMFFFKFKTSFNISEIRSMLITHKNNLKTKFYFNKINNKNNNIIILK